MTVTPEGRYAVDLNSSAYADPYVCGTPYLDSKNDAEQLARDLLPILDDAGKWSILERAAEELPRQLECDAKGWSTGGIWEHFAGIHTGDFLALITALKEGRTGQSTETDWQSYASISSEERVSDDNSDPVYEENFTR